MSTDDGKGTTQASVLDAALLADLEAHVATRAAATHCPSVSWGIVVDGRLAHQGWLGTLGDGHAPTANSVYRIASMTKSFTAAVVLMLRDAGALALDDPLARHAPEFAHLRAPTFDAAPLRLRHLLTMSGGMANDDPWADRFMHIDDAQLDAAFAHGALFAASTGEMFEYSNLGYGLLGRVVRNITGTSLQQWVTERLLAPLGMKRTTWTMPAHDDWARPHRVQDGAVLPEGTPIPDDGALAPMGGLWSTVPDLARWVAWFADAFPARDDRDDGPLCRASRREMQQMHRFAEVRNGVPTGYGFGLMVRAEPELGSVVSHSGGLPGYGSNMRWLGDGQAGRRIGVIALANTTYAPMFALAGEILARLHAHGSIAARSIEAPLLELAARRLVALLGQWDDTVADALFSANVAPDEAYARRRAEGERLREHCGGTLEIARVVAESATSGRIEMKMAGDDSTASIELQLSPLVPARIERYSIVIA